MVNENKEVSEKKEQVKWPAVPLQPMTPTPWPPWSHRIFGGVCMILAFLLIPIRYHPIRLLLAVFAWDCCWGSVPLQVHPVVLVGRFITFFQKQLTPDHVYEKPLLGFLYGLLLLVSTVSISLFGTWGSVFLARSIHPVVAYCLEVTFLKSALSLDLLCRVATQMSFHLEKKQMEKGRLQLCWLCSRDATDLRADELAGGTIESVAENLSDAFVGPLFWYVVVWYVYCPEYPLLGAVFFRTCNTLDSRVGKRGKYEYYGKASARWDDILCLVAARITAILLAIAGWLLPGFGSNDVARGFRTAWRDASQCESWNAGWPMATMAGLLHVRLEKPGDYSLGAGFEPPGYQDIRKGVTIARLAGVLSLGLAIAVLYSTTVRQ